MNKYLNIYLVPYFILPIIASILVSRTNVIKLYVLLESDPVDLEEMKG